MKEQEKLPEEELNEMEVSNLPDRVQNNGYKDAQGTQGELQQHERGHRNHKKEPSEIKAILTEMKNNLQGISSRVHETENQTVICNIRKQNTPNQISKKKKESKNIRIV